MSEEAKIMVRCNYCKKELSLEEAVRDWEIGRKGIRREYYHGACHLPAMIRDFFIGSGYAVIGLILLFGLFVLLKQLGL